MKEYESSIRYLRKSDVFANNTDGLVSFFVAAGAIERLLCFLHDSTFVCNSFVERGSRWR